MVQIASRSILFDIKPITTSAKTNQTTSIFLACIFVVVLFLQHNASSFKSVHTATKKATANKKVKANRSRKRFSFNLFLSLRFIPLACLSLCTKFHHSSCICSSMLSLLSFFCRFVNCKRQIQNCLYAHIC